MTATIPQLNPLPSALNRVLIVATRRLRRQTALRLTSRVLAGGLLLTLLLLWLGRFYPLTWPLLLVLIGVGVTGVGLAVALVYAMLRPIPPQLIARELDQRLQLEERLMTALDLAADQRGTPAAIIKAQRADTVHHLRDFNVARTFPLHLPWPWLGASSGLIIALVISLMLPNPQLQQLQQRAELESLLAEQVAQLEEIQAELLANEALLETPAGEEALQTLDNLIEMLPENSLRPEEALADLAEAEQTLAQLQATADQQKNTLTDLAETFNQFATTEQLAEALQRRDMAEAGEFLQAAAANLDTSPQASQAELAQALEQAAQAAEAGGDNELAEALSEAAQALGQNLNAQGSGGNEQQASEEALQQAAEALANAEQALGNQEALQEALGNIQEAREQLAQAAGGGLDNEGNEASDQEASGQNQGQGRGQGSGPGPGNGSGSGRGEGGNPTNDLFADTPGQEAETNNGPNQGLQGDYDAAFPPIHWGGDGGPLVNPDQQGAEGGLPIGEAPLDPNQAPRPAQVPYNQVYGQYADAAGEALDETYIPLGMKEYVRNYFGALEPGSE